MRWGIFGFNMTDSKGKRKAPAFQFYADDFLAGTITMTNEEKGAYISLLCIQWSRGFLTESDFQRVCAGMPTHSHGICQSKFQIDSDGNYKNKRLEAERIKQKEYSEKQRDIANMRWKSNANALPAVMPESAKAIPSHIPKSCSPSPTPSPNNKIHSRWHLEHGVEVPDSLQSDQCLEALKKWLAYKKETRSAYKKIGLETALTKWSREFTKETLPEAVERSIAAGWKGLFSSFNQSQPTFQNLQPAKKEQDWRDSL